MKVLISILALVGFAAHATPAKFNVDAKTSKVEWLGKKVTGQHNGTIDVKAGTVQFDGKKLVGGEFTIDMKSLKVVDIKDAENNKKLTDHLKSDDFFATAKPEFSEAKLMIKSAKELAPGKAEVTADLTIKGKTAPVTFPADISWKGDTVMASGKIMVDRTKYDIKYASGLFFPNLGDKMIDDKFELTFALNAKK